MKKKLLPASRFVFEFFEVYLHALMQYDGSLLHLLIALCSELVEDCEALSNLFLDKFGGMDLIIKVFKLYMEKLVNTNRENQEMLENELGGAKNANGRKL